MRHETGASLKGMPHSQGARIGVIYISPDDDRRAVLTAILAEEKRKREQIVLVLPQKNKAFQHPADFDDLKMLRRKLQATLIFVTPAGPGPAEFARQRRFDVFSTIESFVHSLTTGSTSQPNQSAPAASQPGNKPGKRGIFGGVRKVGPITAAGAAGEVVRRAGTARNTPSQRRHPAPRPVSGLTPAGDITDLPTQQQPVEQTPPQPLRPTPLPPQTPRPPIEIEDEDEDTGFLPPSIVEADTGDQHDEEKKTGTPDAEPADATTVEEGVSADDDVLHPPYRDQGTGPGPNIESDDDWEALPPLPGQSTPAQVPNTPAAMGTDTASRKTPGTLSRTPTPIVLGATPPTPPKTGKPTKVLPPSATVGIAESPSTPITPPSQTPKRNTGKTVAAGAAGVVAGAALGGALSSTATGKTPATPTRPTTNTGKTPAAPPARNAGAANTLRPAGSISAISVGWPPPSPTRLRSPRGARPANRNRRALLLVALLVILTLLVIGALTVSANPKLLSFTAPPPPATITITPFSKTVSDTYVLTGVNGTSNIANRQVSVRQLTSTKTDTKQVTLAHVHVPPQQATGTITFLNSSATSQMVLSGTIFPVGNVQIITDKQAVIPAATSTTQPGQTKPPIPAHAVQSGSAGNIPAFAINQFPCCGSSSIQAQNQSAFTGGQDAVDYNSLKQDDVNAVTNADQNTLKSSAQNDITGQKKTGEQFLGNINCDNPKTTSDIQINAREPNTVTTTNVTVGVTCNAQVYDANAVQTIAQNNLLQKANKDPQLGPNPVLAGTIATQTQSQTQQNGSTTFTVNASGLWYYNVNKQALLNNIKGKTKAQAQSILNSTAGIRDETIAINNGGTTLPSDAGLITLTINVPAGPSGGSNQTPTPSTSPPTSTNSTPIPTTNPLGS